MTREACGGCTSRPSRRWRTRRREGLVGALVEDHRADAFGLEQTDDGFHQAVVVRPPEIAVYVSTLPTFRMEPWLGVGRFLHYDPVVPVCTHCGEDNPGRAKFCLACGSPLAVMSPRGDERKVVSVLFCDLVGFTSRAERLDVEDVGGLLRPYYTRLRIELERYGGTVEKFIGDAVMALFGAPVSHEDDPARAVRAALAIRTRSLSSMRAIGHWICMCGSG